MATKRDPVLTTEQAAEYLDPNFFSKRTLERWRRESRASGKQKGPCWIELESGRVGYRQSALDAYLSAREAQPSQGDFKT